MTSGISGFARPHGPGLNDARIVACATAIASIAAGTIHVSAAADHENLTLMMAGFVVVAALQLVLGGILIWRRPGQRLITAALSLTAASVGVWVMSRTVGLPLLPNGHVEPVGFKDGVTVLFELATLAGLRLLSRDEATLTLPTARASGRSLAAVACATVALVVPAILAEGRHDHPHQGLIALGMPGHAGSGHDEGSVSGAADDHTSDAADSDHGNSGGSDRAHAADGSRSGHTDHGDDGVELASFHAGTTHPHAGGAPAGGGAGGHGGGGGGNHPPETGEDTPGQNREHGRHRDDKPGNGHRHGGGKGDGGEHEHGHGDDPSGEEPEDDGPLATLADALPPLDGIPPRR
jgi:hypothetical protein